MSDGTVLYVAGAGDRPGTGEISGTLYHARLIREGLTAQGRDFEVIPSRWSDTRPALTAVAPSLPDYVDEMRLPSAHEVLADAASAEPFRNTRLAMGAALQDLGGAADPWGVENVDLWLAALEALAPGPTEAADTGPASGLSGGSDATVQTVLAAAAKRTLHSEEYQLASTVVANQELLLEMVAQDVMSDATRELAHRLPGVPAQDITGMVRDMVEKAQLLFSAVALLASYVPGLDPAPLRRFATDRLVRHRHKVMTSYIGGFTDIVAYLHNGEPIRNVVRSELESARKGSGKLIVLGNSLGGVILFDVLREQLASDGTARPDLFVTVGSQASILETIDAHHPAAPPCAACGSRGWSARPFTPWLNIYDRNDFLGFVAGKVFGEGVTDEEVDLGVGFPDAHGQSYFTVPEVFTRIAAAVDRVGGNA